MKFEIIDLSDLFEGQRVVDRKKDELRRLLPMLWGMLPEKWSLKPVTVIAGLQSTADCLQFEKYGEGYSHAPFLCLMHRFPGGSLMCGSEKSDTVQVLQHNNFSLDQILAIHAALPAALIELVRQIPELGLKLKIFLDQATKD
jgi:hypothetical protein